MDTSKVYITMLQSAVPLQEQKYKSGWLEGDYLWNGEKVCVAGMDYLHIKEYFQQRHLPVFTFAVLEDMPCRIVQEGVPYADVSVKTVSGNYTLKRIGGYGIWIPRLDQLIEIAVKPQCPEKVQWYFNSHVDNNVPYYRYFDTMEKAWLAIIMEDQYKAVWNFMEERWN